MRFGFIIMFARANDGACSENTHNFSFFQEIQIMAFSWKAYVAGVLGFLMPCLVALKLGERQ
jgi:hypothetical protein